jgi:2-polyprenyl-3-methyl-5-hydroxy-6-metoxy-1,4-benzoquinol methylase
VETAGKDSIATHYQGADGKRYALGRRHDILNDLGSDLQCRYFTEFLKKDMNVLDFGCVNGSLANSIAPSVSSIEGLEVNPYTRDLAILRNNLTVFESLDALPPDRIYDAVVSNHVLEHIPNVVETLKGIRDRIVPGGLFITVLPIDDFREKINRKWSSDDPNKHLHTWTPLLFGNTLAEAGFSPQELKIVTSAWTPRLFFLGNGRLQSVAGYFLALMRKRRQLVAVAIN